jgi:hypothetical protein
MYAARGTARGRRAAATERSLEHTFRRPKGELMDLRGPFVCMTDEYARHNGHADLIREHIDGRTGD